MNSVFIKDSINGSNTSCLRIINQTDFRAYILKRYGANMKQIEEEKDLTYSQMNDEEYNNDEEYSENPYDNDGEFQPEESESEPCEYDLYSDELI